MGGGLSLVDHISDYLGLQRGTLSSNWDVGHQIQLVMKDVFKDDTEVRNVYKEVKDFMIGLMQTYGENQKGEIFRETADDILSAVLKNRANQETRWVRALLTAMSAFFRNAGTLHVVLGREEMEAVAEKDSTKQKEILKKSEKLRGARFWMNLIGYTQIFDRICSASLEAQHSDHFATSSLQIVLKEIKWLEEAGACWSWDEKDSFAGIGSFKEHIENIRNGFFVQKVGLRSKQIRSRKINSLRQYYKELDPVEREDDDILVHPEDIRCPEIPICGWNIVLQRRVEAHLQRVCKKIHSAFQKRFNAPPLILEACQLFHDNYDWYDDTEEEEDIDDVAGQVQPEVVEDEDIAVLAGLGRVECNNTSPLQVQPGVVEDEDAAVLAGLGRVECDNTPPLQVQPGVVVDEDVVEEDEGQLRGNFQHAKSQISPILKQVVRARNTDDTGFDWKNLEACQLFHDNYLDTVVDGFLKFVKLAKENPNIAVEAKFEKFLKIHGKFRSNKNFIRFFRDIQIRSFSEAIAETVGSLMVLSIGKNRYLEPVNFGKEMVLMFNLPPMHILSEAFIPELIEELLDKKKKRMFRKRDGAFPSWSKRLVSEVLSASLFNFRRKEEESSRLRLDCFRKM